MPNGWIDSLEPICFVRIFKTIKIYHLGLDCIHDHVDYSDNSQDTDDEFAYELPAHEPEAFAAQEPPANLNTEGLCQGPAKR